MKSFKEYLKQKLDENDISDDKKKTAGKPTFVGKNHPPTQPPFFYIYDLKSMEKDAHGNERYSALRKDNYRVDIHPSMVADLETGNSGHFQAKWWPEYLEWAKNNKSK